MSMPPIEDGVEIPDPHWKLTETRTAYLKSILPGQSFAVPFRNAAVWRVSMSQRGFKGMFISRRIGNNVRIWRKQDSQTPA